MRKVKPARKLGRTAAHRKATLSNLSTQLLVYKRIETTEAKAKETRRVVEKIITKARKGTVHAQREIFKVQRSGQHHNMGLVVVKQCHRGFFNDLILFLMFRISLPTLDQILIGSRPAFETGCPR